MLYEPRTTDIAQLAASYAFSIARNHAFNDGNKRTAWIAARVFLADNGYELTFTTDDAIQAVVSPAASELDREGFAQWLRDRIVSTEPAEQRDLVVFLDFDDVIVVDGPVLSYQIISAFKERAHDDIHWRSVFSLACIKQLQRLQRNFSPKYVISSSWTTALSRDEISMVLRFSGLAWLEHSLHDQWTTPKQSGWNRRQEIEAWLQQYQTPLTEFLIIDDTDSGASLKGSELDTQGHVVLFEFGTGFNEDRYIDARNMLLKRGKQ